MIYGIDKKTKEHRLVTDDPEESTINNPGFSCYYVEADAEGWIPWEGGECPLPYDAQCQYKTREGVIRKTAGVVSKFRWRHSGSFNDIIAYRPILDAKPSKPEAPEWDGGLPQVGAEVECWHTGSHQGVVTVRYMGSEMCVLLNHDHGEEQCGPIEAYSFRPIRSERDKAVSKLMEDAELMRAQAERVIDAGYRKQ